MPLKTARVRSSGAQAACSERPLEAGGLWKTGPLRGAAWLAGSAVPLAQICILQFDKGPGGMLQTRQAAGAFSAMTANAFTEDMEKSKEAGMDEHLSKPVDIAVLERAVRKYLVTPPPKMRDRQPRFTR